MAILKDILKDSRDYYQDLERRLRARLKNLPRGSVLKRRIGRKDYYYLVYRNGNRVISGYLGKNEPLKIKKGIKERRQIRLQLREVLQNLRMLQRVEGRKRG